MLLPSAALTQRPAGVLPVLAVTIVGALTLAGAWVFQYGFDILPCQLCLEQRYAYYFVIVFGAVLGLAAYQGLASHWVIAGLVLLALATLANAGLGIYHSGVEWGLWKGPTACTGTLPSLGSAGSLLEQLNKVKVIRCDEVQWRFLGLSLAGYNVLISLFMTALAVWGVQRLRTAR